MRVELTAVRKRYGTLDALAGIDLDLPAGSRVALIGPNGSGKTTLTRVIMGLVAHDGAVRLDGAPAGIARIQADARIAYVPQVAPQMAASVGELLRTIAAVRGVTVRAIADVAAELGLDVAEVSARPFRGLSGGMKQKLLIALAFAIRPRLVILDEPTASLDAAARARFVELERELLAGATVILCSHRLDELRTMVDRVVALEEGRIVHDGAADEFVVGHTRSVFEVLLAGTAGSELLTARGFALTAGGWWSRPVDHAEKLALLPEIAGLGVHLRDLVVRDHDRLTLPAEAP
jgi:ABC-2 type transport system ATP-binding protein